MAMNVKEVVTGTNLLLEKAKYALGYLVISAAVLSVGSVIGHRALAMLGGVMLILSPFVWWITRDFIASRLAEQMTKRGETAFRNFIGEAPDHMNVAMAPGVNQGTMAATGIALAGDRVFIMDRGIATSFPFSQIRSWEWKIVDPRGIEVSRTTGIPSSVSASIQAHETARQNQVAALRESGLFISVDDVNHPLWHFMSKNKGILSRWHEILQQLDANHRAEVAA